MKLALERGCANWKGLADQARIRDKELFITCITEQWSASKIAQDTTVAGTLEIEGVPTLVINRGMYYGMISLPALETLILDETGLSIIDL